ncbi:MAG TPA: formylglycine-generating enzyme family protein [Phycisphaerae bacterium]|nr:formylglycine-generating enzyme family protein [Phycisphaerae bacterium]
MQRIVRLTLISAAVGMTLAGGLGCSHSSPLVDRTAVLPSHVILPEGFYPLAGHYDPDNPEDQYNGWPRYIVSERDNMVMAYVPTQTITMGGGIAPDEVPSRQVVVSHFYMDLHEITNGQFHKFRKACTRHGPGDVDCYRDYWVRGLNDDHPVRAVSWLEARYYSRWIHKVLPTEAQWEAAARGDDRRIYPWGNEEQVEAARYLCNHRTDRANFDGYEYTAPVMNFAAGVSPYGVFQLSGNVAEWCADWYDPGRYAYPSDEDLPTGLERGARAFGDENYPNPIHKILRESRIGPLRGSEKVVRGGSFSEPIGRCRVDSRWAAGPHAHLNNVGFRCALPLPPEGPQG